MAQLRLTDENGTCFCTCTLEELLQDNTEDEEIQEEIPKLQVGQSYPIGGGAAPVTVIERIS